MKKAARAREVGDSAAARFAGSAPISLFRSWGLRPRLYAATCSAGSALNKINISFAEFFFELVQKNS
jgi:hypothetical protein